MANTFHAGIIGMFFFWQIFFNQLFQTTFHKHVGILSVSNILDPDQAGQNNSENVHSDLESMAHKIRV